MTVEPEEEATEESDSDSDSSWKSISPITSEEEYWTDSDEEESSESDVEEVPTDSYTHQATSNPQHIGENSSVMLQSEVHPICIILYRLCGDNVDKTIKHRYMRINIHEGSISLHYFHAYAVADRIDFSKLSDTPPMSLGTEAQAFMILPSLEDDSDLEENFKILIARVLCENLPFFKETFDGVVTWHIKHCYYEEMSKKSDIVSCTPCM